MLFPDRSERVSPPVAGRVFVTIFQPKTGGTTVLKMRRPLVLRAGVPAVQVEKPARKSPSMLLFPISRFRPGTHQVLGISVPAGFARNQLRHRSLGWLHYLFVGFLAAWGVSALLLPGIGTGAAFAQQESSPSLDEIKMIPAPAPTVTVPSLTGPRDRLIAMQICELLRSEHLSRHAVDETVARAAVRLYLDSLDPMKCYFYRSDVETFLERWPDVLQTANRGDLKLATDVYTVFLARIIEREAMVLEILQEDFDFSVDEEFMYDRDPLPPERGVDESFADWQARDLESCLRIYPTKSDDAVDFWRKRLKYEMLVIEADRQSEYRRECEEATKKGEPEPALAPIAPEDSSVRRLERRYVGMRRRAENTSADDILEQYLCAIMAVYDPHTSYMSPTTMDSFAVGIDLRLQGIGAALRFIDGFTMIEEVLPGSPAALDGRLRKGDRLLAVGQGESGPMEDVVDMKLTEVVRRVRGERGTRVRILVQTTTGERNTVELTRDAVSMKDRQAKGAVFVCGQKSSGAPYRIGLIRLSSFYRDRDAVINGNQNFTSASRDVGKILKRFNDENVDAVVLDFRSNGGGVLEEAVEMTGLFIVDGPVSQLRDTSKTIRPCMDDDPAVAWSKPMIVVVDKLSASATEIFVGAVQDMKRGLIVGDYTTHGKGTVQRLIDLSERTVPTAELGAMKVTMQQFFTPSGRTPQLTGILSDVELPSLTTYLDIGERDLRYPLPSETIPAANYMKYDNFVTDEILGALREKSTERVKHSEYFQRVERVIENYLSQKAKKSISLNREKFLLDRAEVDAANVRDRQMEKLAETEGEIRKDSYIEEVLMVMADYLPMLKP